MMRSLAAALLFSGVAMAEPQIAITYDDLPVHGVLPSSLSRVGIAKEIIEALKAARVPPTYGLINGVHALDDSETADVFTLWRASGNLLGNHTWTHPGLSKSDVATYEADTLKNEALLEKYASGSDWHWFRYPFLDEGKDEVQRAVFRAFLAARHYKIAAVTMGLNDWDYPEPYARCLAKNDSASIATLDAMFLKHADESADYARKLSALAVGRDVPYILLQHIGSFQAHILSKLLALYKAKGFSFVSLEKASADPYYSAYLDPSLPAPPRNLEQVITAKGGQPPKSSNDHIAELQAMCR